MARGEASVKLQNEIAYSSWIIIFDGAYFITQYKHNLKK